MCRGSERAEKEGKIELGGEQNKGGRWRVKTGTCLRGASNEMNSRQLTRVEGK